ncbi:type II toxin-antitoxin system PemK/MazF family toxin [Desulfonatronum thioautotrophicum]|uniref:type II toxin-antitoxin system PemK/MazF family toxin n=1 Tax=Desulfonatronum thioautotrophicum TaxID=617001 RepID=UPI0005EB4529|nr:type II toxin-antitoxin system PemK/MazF family toxin [Desulfonatronum thioautotrophicum]
MRRGDFVTVSVSGDFGKPRPALIIQADIFDHTATVTVLLVTSTLVDAPLFRILASPNKENGLSKPSQVMVDKCMTVKREKVGEPFGKADKGLLREVSRCMAVFLGLA